MRNMFNSNWMTVGLMGVLLLLASAVGRIAAGNVSAWLTGPQARGDHASAPMPDRMELTALTALRVR